MTKLMNARPVALLVGTFNVTIGEKNQHFMSRYHALLMPLMLALLSYVGVDGYGVYQERQAAAAPAEVTVNIDSVPDALVEDKVRSDKEIQALIDAALAKQKARHECAYHGNCDE